MGMSGQHHASAALYPRGKDPPIPIAQKASWALEPVWTQRLEEKFCASVGDRTPVVQSVVRHYTDWATAAPVFQDTIPISSSSNWKNTNIFIQDTGILAGLQTRDLRNTNQGRWSLNWKVCLTLFLLLEYIVVLGWNKQEMWTVTSSRLHLDKVLQLGQRVIDSSAMAQRVNWKQEHRQDTYQLLMLVSTETRRKIFVINNIFIVFRTDRISLLYFLTVELRKIYEQQKASIQSTEENVGIEEQGQY
jgi:hypothetical protein